MMIALKYPAGIMAGIFALLDQRRRGLPLSRLTVSAECNGDRYTLGPSTDDQRVVVLYEPSRARVAEMGDQIRALQAERSNLEPQSSEGGRKDSDAKEKARIKARSKGAKKRMAEIDERILENEEYIRTHASSQRFEHAFSDLTSVDEWVAVPAYVGDVDGQTLDIAALAKIADLEAQLETSLSLQPVPEPVPETWIIRSSTGLFYAPTDAWDADMDPALRFVSSAQASLFLQGLDEGDERNLPASVVAWSEVLPDPAMVDGPVDSPEPQTSAASSGAESSPLAKDDEGGWSILGVPLTKLHSSRTEKLQEIGAELHLPDSAKLKRPELLAAIKGEVERLMADEAKA